MERDGEATVVELPVGKQPLNPIKVRTIFNVCYQQFPMDRLENPLQAEKEMRNAIDEQCR